MPKPKPAPTPGIANPFPVIHGTGPVNVTLIGDSLLYQAGPYISGALLWDGMTTPNVSNLAIGGTGLLDDLGQPRFQSLIDAVAPGSVVVVEYSGNCFWGPGGGCPFVPNTAEFLAAWEQAMRDRMAYVTSKGLKQVWCKPPLVGPAQGGHADTVYSVALLTQRVCAELGIRLVDWGTALNDTLGSYRDTLWYAEVFAAEMWHTVRDVDQLHFTVDGAKRAAAWTAAGIIAAL